MGGIKVHKTVEISRAPESVVRRRRRGCERERRLDAVGEARERPGRGSSERDMV